MSSKEQVIEAALKLSEEERLEIAERLYESVEEPVDEEADEAWDREIKRRLKLVDSGQTKALPWEEARRKIMEDGDGGARGMVR